MKCQTWPLSEAARVANINHRALRQWNATGVLPLLNNDKLSKGTGNRCGYSLPRILQTAITRHLDLLGFGVGRAAKWAFEFTDRGNIARQPSVCFPTGRTILVITTEGATVKNIFADTALRDLSDAECVLTVDINKIFAQVTNSLFKKA